MHISTKDTSSLQQQQAIKIRKLMLPNSTILLTDFTEILFTDMYINNTFW